MLDEAAKGNIDVYEKSHVLGLFRDTHDKIQIIELSDDELDLLQFLEDGPQSDRKFVTEKNRKHFDNLAKKNLILDLMPA
jgi:hypothetical protein